MLELSDKSLLNNMRTSCSQVLSEYSFANLYLFRHVHNYEVVKGRDVYIKGKTLDGFTYLMPISPASFEALVKEADLIATVDFLFPIPVEWIKLIDKEAWHITHLDADSDYLYDLQHLSKLEGRGLSKKRNLVSQFTKQYEATMGPFNADDAATLLNRWKESHTQQKSDAKECLDAIVHMDMLDLDGVIYYVDQKPIGFMIGQKLTSDTYVLHFAKADVSYKGIYQYMYQTYAELLKKQYAFINMEQDMGIPALRQAKHSYEPIKMCKKLRLKKV
ncbi:MAG: phosphatidylglycerol lysyltransferase domain-containing protein [Chlamydiales bacterium]|nr:phosphatidylglycerol lysyltransferase domain-containing protein [Chlamydiales bacterium]